MKPDHHKLGTPADVRQWGIEKRAPEFWARVDQGEPQSCWEWTGGRDRKGYGQTSWYGRNLGAHVVAWALAAETDPPKGRSLVVCHHCDNPPCCNPAHLYLGTQAQNIADRDRRGRSVYTRGTAHLAAKLTAEQVREIRARHAAGESYPSLGREFGVHAQRIGAVCRRESYTDVD